MTSEQQLINDAIARLQDITSLPVDIEPASGKSDKGYDYIIEIAEHKFIAIIRSSISQGNKNFIFAPLSKAIDYSLIPPIIVAEWIPKEIAKEYTAAGVNYIDRAGNCSIRAGNLQIRVEGKKTEKVSATKQSRAFQEAGIRVIFELLTDPAALNITYRELAARVDVSLGSVGSVMRELTDLDFVFEAEKKRILKNTSQLLERWVTAYHDVLRPRLITKRLRFTQPDQLFEWENLPLQSSDYTLLWGGEPGAALLTNYLTPEKFTLYTDGNWQEVMRTLKLLPAENGDIEVLDMFWKHEDKRWTKQIVPPLLIYADLMGSRIGRNLETAKLIRDNELSPLLQ